MIKFIIPGEPQGKARARVTRFGNYTPEKTVNYEALIKHIYTQKTEIMHIGQLAIDITAYYSIPKSYSYKKQREMEEHIIRPTKKPDGDNILKIVADALNKIAYNDDSQIVEARIRKYYSHAPRVEVVLNEII
jgi:Holliday junction resolvase RusA-like endonuclease